MDKRGKDGLTARRRKFLKAAKNQIVEHGEIVNIAAATREAGYRDRQYGEELLQNPSILVQIDSFLAKFNKHVPDELLIKTTLAGLRARKTEFAKHEGKIMDERSLIDYGVRHEYLETALKVKRILSATKEALTGGQTVNFNFSIMQLARDNAEYERKMIEAGHNQMEVLFGKRKPAKAGKTKKEKS